MAGIKTKVGKFKDWIIPDEENTEEEFEGYEEEYDDYEEYDDSIDDSYEDSNDDLVSSYSTGISQSRVTDYHSVNHMKVVLLQPRQRDDAQIIADNIKLKKTVIVNLDFIEDKAARQTIFDFMNGALYVSDATINKVARHIYIVAPKNVDVDADLKRELESKAEFPWQGR